MEEPLLYDELSAPQRQLLVALSKHPGWELLVLLFHKSCDQINSRLVKLDPMDVDYDKKLARAHLQARTVNEFCSAIKKSVEFYSKAEELQRVMTEADIRATLEEAEHQLRAGNPVPAYPVESNTKD